MSEQKIRITQSSSCGIPKPNIQGRCCRCFESGVELAYPSWGGFIVQTCLPCLMDTEHCGHRACLCVRECGCEERGCGRKPCVKCSTIICGKLGATCRKCLLLLCWAEGDRCKERAVWFCPNEACGSRYCKDHGFEYMSLHQPITQCFICEEKQSAEEKKQKRVAKRAHKGEETSACTLPPPASSASQPQLPPKKTMKRTRTRKGKQVFDPSE